MKHRSQRGKRRYRGRRNVLMETKDWCRRSTISNEMGLDEVIAPRITRFVMPEYPVGDQVRELNLKVSVRSRTIGAATRCWGRPHRNL
jgi:hypothetical protein